MTNIKVKRLLTIIRDVIDKYDKYLNFSKIR